MVNTKSGNLQWSDETKSPTKSARRNSQNFSTNRSSRHSISRRSISHRPSDGGLEKRIGSMSNILPVLADNGKDVTPKPLFIGGPHEKAEQIKLEDAAAASDFKSLASMLQTGIGTGTGAYTGTGIFGKSVIGSGIRNSVRSMSIASQSALYEADVGEEDMFNNASDSTLDSPEMQHKHRPESTGTLTDEQLEIPTSIDISETDTIVIFQIIGTAVCEETESIERIKEINDDYEALCVGHLGNDKYSERGMQTFNNLNKHKEAATNPMSSVDVGCQVSSCILWDAFNTDVNVLAAASSRELKLKAKDDERKKSLSETILSESAGSDTLSSQTRMVAKRQSISAENNIEEIHNEILESDEMSASLILVERVLTQNIYQRNIGLYRGLPELDHLGVEITPDPSQSEPNINRLWSFSTLLTKGYTVTCIAWNRINPDIIAISYGYNVKHKSIDASDSNAGLVCCWNIKNLEHPERIYNLPSCATCCDFSQANPNLLAVGLYNGTVVVYNVTRKGNVILLDSMDSVAKHLGPVWSVRWTERERGTDERGEVLVSTSADGRVVQWTIRKGFESLVLMKVKRVEFKKKGKTSKAKDASRKTESARISQFAPTTAFDFHPSDGNTYLIGTEEGTIHRCSCSYNEQFLDSYSGHTGPVYSVKWHPKVESVFLSCSEDWTIQLWHQKRPNPIIVLQSGQRPIKHIEWSPYTYTLFVAITDVSIDVWDVTYSILDPVISMPFRTELSIFDFSPKSNCIVVGDTDGAVNVYQIRGFHSGKDKEAIVQLIKASITSH